jgi:hypothetical protein
MFIDSYGLAFPIGAAEAGVFDHAEEVIRNLDSMNSQEIFSNILSLFRG